MRHIGRILKNRILPIVLAAALLSGGVSASVFASEIVDENVSENVTEIVMGEGVEDGITNEEPNKEELNSHEDVHEEESEGVQPEEIISEETDAAAQVLEAAGFTELGEDNVFTAEQMESKFSLASVIDDFDGCEAGEDYVENEIVVAAEDYDTALMYADAFNAELIHYEFGNALLRLRPRQNLTNSLKAMKSGNAQAAQSNADMVELAVYASAQPGVNLPAAWPNYYDELLDTSYEYDEFDDYTCEYDDPYLTRDGDYFETSPQLYQWHHEAIGSNTAWRAGYRGQGIKVAVIDSGTYDHSDIAWSGSEHIDENGNTSYDAACPNDKYGSPIIHGTSVSGIIGAYAGNLEGGAGIAPECEMYMYRVVEEGGSIQTYAESTALSRAVNNYGADVVNISIGGPHYTDYFSGAVTDAYSKGVVVVCAAGNDGLGASLYPAAYTGAVSVAATNGSGARTDFSNFGAGIRYGAPGEDISLAGTSSTYRTGDGTSYAAPVVAGIVAVMLSSGKIGGEGGERVDNVLKMLDKSCSAVDGLGKGIPNLAAALGLDANNNSVGIPAADKPSGTYTDKELVVSLATVNSGSNHEDMIFYSDNGKNVSFANGRPSDNAIRYNPAEKITVSGKRSTTIKAIAVNPSNGLVSRQVSYTYTLKPLVESVEVTTDTGQYKLQKGAWLGFTAKCTPSYAGNTAVSYAVTGYPDDSPPKTRAYISGSRLYAPANVTPGTYTITCTARDSGHAETSFEVSVYNPEARVYSIAVPKTSLTIYAADERDYPEVPEGASDEEIERIGRITNEINEKTTEQVQITLTTMEGRTRYYAPAELYCVCTSSNESVVSVTDEEGKPAISGNTLTLRALKTGTATVRIVSNDGTKISKSIRVTVRKHPSDILVNEVTGGKVAAGKSIKLTAEVYPADAYNRAVTWSIVSRPDEATDRTSATINTGNGTFYATKATPGIYKVRATARDKNILGKTVACEYDIEVSGDPTKRITLEKKSVGIFRKQNAYKSATAESVQVDLQGGSYESLNITSQNPGIVSAKLRREDDGTIYADVSSTGNSVGSSKITVRTNDGTGKSAAFTVTVSNPPSCLEISSPIVSCSNLAKGRSIRLTAKFGTIYGKLTSASRKLEWKSNHPEIISVNKSGTVTARASSGPGVTITARTTDGSNLTAHIVLYPVANTTGITTDGMWERMKKTSDGSIFGEITSFLVEGHTGYVSLSNSTNDTSGNLPSINRSTCDISVNKPGLTVKWSTATRESGKPNATIALYAYVPGTYYVTVRMRDKSPATRKIKVVVKSE